jgi:hypothetical protein
MTVRIESGTSFGPISVLRSVCDLQHHAAAAGLHFGDALGKGDRNYSEETAIEAEHGPGAAG